MDAVYSAALRQVRSTALAEEISQSVFLDLSKSASKLKPAQPLIAWLYLVTRRTAIDVIRRESRRQAREQIASEIAAMKSNPPVWAQVAPFLEEALETLNEEDRQVLLLRYIASKSLREVGENLGTSEDAAQKRVSRALDQLRAIFARRGIAITATGLATDLSANVVVSAPVGLGASISASSLPVIVATQTTHTIAMTALNKTLITVSLLLAASLAYQMHLFASRHDQLLALDRKNTELRTQSQQLREESDHAAALLAKKRAELSAVQARASENALVEADLEAWLTRVSLLKNRLIQMPEKSIPEMRFLTFTDWLTVTLNNGLQTESKVRFALSELRFKAKLKPEISPNIDQALRAFRKAHNGHSATDFAQARLYLHSLLDDDILQRYEFVPDISSAPSDNFLLREKAAVDDDFDVLFNFSKPGFGIQNVSKLGDSESEAVTVFRKANNGEYPKTPEQLLPYFTKPVDAVHFKEFWEARRP